MSPSDTIGPVKSANLVTLDGDDTLVLDIHLLAASDSAEGTDALSDTIGRDQPGLEGLWCVAIRLQDRARACHRTAAAG